MSKTRETRKRIGEFAKRLYLDQKAVKLAMEHAAECIAEGSTQTRQFEAAQFLVRRYQGLTVRHVEDGRRETPRVSVMQKRIIAYWLRQVKTIGRTSRLDDQQQTLSDVFMLMDGDDLQSIAQVCRFYAPAYIGALSNGPSHLVDQIEVIENLDWQRVAEEVLWQWRQVQAKVEARHGREGRRLKRQQRKACDRLAAC